MPKFHGHDYYFLAISERTTGLSEAILVFPKSLQKHVHNCCINLLDILDTQSSCPHEGKVETFSDSFGTECKDLARAAQLFQDLRDETVESYQKDVIIGHDGSELLEVIPSSNPESCRSLDSCFEECTLSCTQYFCLEKFALVNFYTDNDQPFDEPLSVNHCRLAVEALPSASALLSRLAPFELDDPLLKLDGSKWNQQDILHPDPNQYEHCMDIFDADEIFPMQEEIFDRLLIGVKDEMTSEPLIPYYGPDIEFETSPGHIYSLDYIGEVIDSESCSEKEHSFILENCDSIKSKLISGLSNVDLIDNLDNSWTDDYSRHVIPFVILNNIGVSPDSPVDDSGRFLEGLSPFVEYRIAEMVGEEALPNCLLKYPLEDLHAEDGLFTECAPIVEDFKLMERHIWGQEKRFDEIQLPEPIFTKEFLPDLIPEVSACLKLQPEDTLVHDEVIQWSFDQPDTISSMYDIATLACDVCIQQFGVLESFDKFESSELDFILNCNHDKAEEDTVGNESTHNNTAVECVDVCLVDKINQENLQSPDPLESFIHVRAKSESHLNADGQNCMNRKDKSDCPAENETQRKVGLVAALPESSREACTNIKTVQAIFSGPWEKVMQCIMDCAGSHLNIIKQVGLITPQQDIMDISVDMTRFLLKEREKLISDVTLPVSESHVSGTVRENILQSLTVVHLLRTAAELLLNACLESCISYLAASIEDSRARLGKSCDEVHKLLFQYQCQFLQKDIIHPKLSVLSHEMCVHSTQFPGCKILIITQKGLNRLVSAIQNVLSKVPQLTVIVVKDLKNVDPERTTVYVTTLVETWTDCITQFSLVILYDERQAPHIKSTCQDKGVSYVGLLTQHLYDGDKNDRNEFLDKMPAVTLICSTEVTHHKQLVCLLETRYNIMVIEREYYQLCRPNDKIYFADLIVSVTHCIVLLSLQDMKKHWNLTAAMKTFVALGLQFSHCFIILHGMDAGNSYVIEKETLSNIYKLTAALCNLKGASPLFGAFYKVFMSQKDEDVASRIRSIVDSYLICKSEAELLRPWLSADASQDEVMLLQLNCLNSFSAQMLLNRLTVAEILAKSDGELATLFPNIPERIIKYLHYMTSRSKCQQQPSSADSSQVCDVSGFSSSSSHTMVTQTYSPLSGNGSGIDADTTQAEVPECDFQVRIIQSASQTSKSAYPLVIEDGHKLQPSYCTKLDIDPNRLAGDEGYSFSREPNTADMPRSELVNRSTVTQQCSDSVHWENTNLFLNSKKEPDESSDHRGNKQGTSKSHYGRSTSHSHHHNQNYIADIREHYTQANADKEDTIKSKHESGTSYSHQYSQNNLAYTYESGYTDGVQVNANFQTKSGNISQAAVVSNRQTVTNWSLSAAYQSPSYLKPSVQQGGDFQGNLMIESCAFRDTSTSNQHHGQLSSMHSFGLPASFRKVIDDEESAECCRLRPMQILDTQAYDEHPTRSTFKPINLTKLDSISCKDSPNVNHDNYDRNMLDFHENELSPYRIHSETLWSTRDTNGRSTVKDGLPFNFSLSNKPKEYKSFLQSRLLTSYDPEDGMNEGRFNLIEELHKANIPDASLQKSRDYFENDGGLSSYGAENYEGSLVDFPHYSTSNIKSNFLNSFTGSSFVLHEHPVHNERSHTTDAHTYSSSHVMPNFLNSFTGSSLEFHKHPIHNERSHTSDLYSDDRGKSFGIFSSKAQRDTSKISSVPGEDPSHPHSIDTNLTAEYTSRHIMSEAPTLAPRQPSSGFHPVDVMRDKTRLDFDSMPFSVSRELKKHIRKLDSTSRVLHNPFIEGNQTSVRVSRQPDLRNNNTSLNNGEGSQSFVHNQIRSEHVRQQEFQDPVRVTHPAIIHGVGQTATKQPYPACYKDNPSCIPKFEDSAQTVPKNGLNKLISLSQKGLNNSSNRSSPTHNCPSLTCAHHISCCSSNPQPRNVTVANHHEKCQVISSYDATKLSDTVGGSAQPIRQQSRIPYTPRHGVAVGLAQPFPRQTRTVEHSEDASTRSPSRESIRQQSGSMMSHVRNTTVLSGSPPMDLAPYEDISKYRSEERTPEYDRSIYEAKRKKWNKHLLSCTLKDENSSRLAISNSEACTSKDTSSRACPTSNRKRRLQLEKRPCNNGQTVLVFK